MQITTDMVAAAWIGWKEYSSKNKNALGEDLMRAALEAALGAKGGDGPALINRLRRACFYQNVTGEVRTFQSDASNGLVVDAADCIEDLAGALKEALNTQEEWEESVSKVIGWPVNVFRRAIDRSRATLERWGLK